MTVNYNRNVLNTQYEFGEEAVLWAQGCFSCKRDLQMKLCEASYTILNVILHCSCHSGSFSMLELLNMRSNRVLLFYQKLSNQ